MTAVSCKDCGWVGEDRELVSRHPFLKDGDYSYCPHCESDEIEDVEEEGGLNDLPVLQ